MWSLPSATGALSTVPNSTCSCVVARFAQSFWAASSQTWGLSPLHAAQLSTAMNWSSQRTCAALWTPICTRSASGTSCPAWPALFPRKGWPSDERDKRESRHVLALASLVADAEPVGSSNGALEPRFPDFGYCRAARRAAAWPDDKRHRFRRERAAPSRAGVAVRCSPGRDRDHGGGQYHTGDRALFHARRSALLPGDGRDAFGRRPDRLAH